MSNTTVTNTLNIENLSEKNVEVSSSNGDKEIFAQKLDESRNQAVKKKLAKQSDERKGSGEEGVTNNIGSQVQEDVNDVTASLLMTHYSANKTVSFEVSDNKLDSKKSGTGESKNKELVSSKLEENSTNIFDQKLSKIDVNFTPIKQVESSATTQTNEAVTDLPTVKSTQSVEQYNDSTSTTQATALATTQMNEAVTNLPVVKSTHVEQHNDSVSTTQTTVPATTQTNEVVTDLLTVKSTHVEQHNDSVSTTQATVPATTQTNEAVTDLSTVKSTHVEQHNDSVSTTQTTVPATTQTNEAVTGLMAVNIEQLPTIQAKATAASTEGSLNITPIEDSALSMSQASNSENNSGIGQGKLAKLINSAQAANNTLINKAAIGESIGSFANFQFENTVVVEQVDSGLSSMNNASTSQLNWNLTSSSASTNLANSLAEQLTMISNPGNKLITINLIPKNLGNVQVTIKVEQNQVSLAVKVQNEEVKQLFGTVTNKLDQILQNQSFANNNVTSKDQSLNNFFQPNFSFDSSDSQRQLFQREKKNGNFVPKVRNGSFSKQQKAKQEETDLKSTISILV